MLKKQTFPIIGMHCASCKALIESLVSEIRGVSHVVVNYVTEKMTVEYDEGKVTVDDLKKTAAKVEKAEQAKKPTVKAKEAPKKTAKSAAVDKETK